METIGGRLDRFKGLGPGFDFLRIALACAVVAWHVPAIVTGDLSYSRGPVLWMLGYFILASFFSLSGFLIAGSALRLSLGNFLINRGLRIVPALAVEVVLCALVLGPIFTTLALAEYFRDPGTWHYFTNIIGWVNFVLPGVFKDHPTEIVNNTLWTVPHEIGCYIIMSGLILFGLLKRPMLVFVLPIVIIAAGFALQAAGIDENSTGFGKLLWFLFVGKASRLYVSFCLGIVIFLMRDRIPYSPKLFGASLVWCLAVGLIPQEDGVNFPLMSLLLAAPMCYITAYLGVTSIWIPSLFRRGDYSYGIYLYGWPLQQVLLAVLPQGTNPWIQFLLVIPFITLFAAFSWHMIEKPILQLRKKFSFVARVRLAEETEAKAGTPEAAAKVPQN